MKATKLLISVILLLTVVISLTGCIVIPRYKNYEIKSEEVSAILIYDLHDSKTHDDAALESGCPVYTLEADKTTDFLSDLAGIRFNDALIITVAAIDPSFSFGDWVARIEYTDGSYILISSGGYGVSYDKSADRERCNHYSCDEELWNEFIEKYVCTDKDITENTSEG